MKRLLAGIALGLAYLASAAAAEIPVIAAASDLQFALGEISSRFTRETAKQVKLSMGSSGNFKMQISAGAPFELFMSADESYVDALHKEGRTLDSGTLYAIGRIVLFAPHGSALKPDPAMRGLADLIAAGQVGRFAIANPEHAPYGRAAREALSRAGLWDKLQGRLVLGENISQAAQFAASGNAQGGIIAYSLVLSPNMSKWGIFSLLPAQSHAPLRQRMVLLKGAGPTAREFYAYLQGAAGREVFKQYGFVLPGD